MTTLLQQQLGNRVTVTNPDNPAGTWTGTLTGLYDEPVLLLEQDDGAERALPQRFTVTPARSAPRIAVMTANELSATEDVRDQLGQLHAATGWDFAVRIEAGAHSAWSAEIRVTPDPYRADGPDRSAVIFATGGISAGAVLAEAWDDLMAWVTENHPGDASKPCPYCGEDA